MFDNTQDYGKEGLFIEARQLSWLFSALLLFIFFVFWAGYFLGQKKVISQFAHTLEHTLPQAHYESQGDSAELAMPIKEPAVVAPVVQAVPVKSFNAVPVPKERYYAQLASFDSEAQAQKYAKYLQTCEVPVHVKERTHTTPSGRVTTWYQVVTEMFENKAELESFVMTLSKQEKLRDICFVCC